MFSAASWSGGLSIEKPEMASRNVSCLDSLVLEDDGVGEAFKEARCFTLQPPSDAV